MASFEFAPQAGLRKRIPLAHIDAVVSARLGPTRGLGNSQPAAFNRQVAVYLAKNVGRWTTTIIGRFYNGRDHSTVCYCIQKIEKLVQSNPEIEALVADLRKLLVTDAENGSPIVRQLPADPRLESVLSQPELEGLADLVAARVYERIEARFRSDS
jgi:hypothetical protein